jgi:hypothetical protein
MYKLIYDNLMNKNTGVQRLSDMACIPLDLANIDYQTYLKWLDGYEYQITEPMKMEWVKTSDGNTPLPADEYK